MTTDSDVAAAQQAAVDKALRSLDLDAKVRLLAGQDAWSLPAIPDIGLRSIVMSDGPIGVRGRQWSGDAAIALPSPTAQAAAWDPELARRSGRLLAQEARRKGVHVLLAPTINLHRSPLGGRHFEAQSEDPLLTGAMAAGFVRGVQDGGVATTVKHFVANDAETDRMSVDNLIDEAPLRELYLAPFEAVVRAGGWGVMSAYNSVNGTSMTENSVLQHGVLREEWGFDGFIVSDWTASRDTVASANGGTDVAMPGPDTVYGEALAAAVREGTVAESTVDAMARRVLLLAARVGALAGAPRSVAMAELPATIDGASHAREVARRSFVLVKNERRLLPLPTNHSLAIIGLPAKEARVMGGGSAQVFPPRIVSPLEGLRAILPATTPVEFVPALDPRTKLPAVRENFRLRGIARDADGVVLHEQPLAEGQITWLGEMPQGVDYEQLHSVEITGKYLASATGSHQFSVAGLGAFRLAVNGAELFAGSLHPEISDVVAGFVDPPERRIAVDLAAEVPVDISVTWTKTEPNELPFPMVSFRLGHADPLPDVDDGIAAAAQAAREADSAVVFVATTEAVESEGFDRADLALPGRQDELVAAVAAANRNTVVVVTAGAPVEMPWADDVGAILLTWFGGQEFGHALADVLTGTHEPSGRLPTSWPVRLADAPVTQVEPSDGRLRYTEGRDIGYRAWQQAGTTPAWWFGHGLGYTQWEYLSAEFAAAPDDPDNLGTVTVRLRNRGDRGGREVVQVYLESGTEEQPLRRLVGFAAVSAAADQSIEVAVPIVRRATQTWDAASRDWRSPTGEATLGIGRSVADIQLWTVVPE